MPAIRTFLMVVSIVLLLLPEAQSSFAAYRLSMGSEKLIGTSLGDCRNVRQAYNRHNDEYLVAFEYHVSGADGIMVRRISSSGAFLGGFAFAPANGSATFPDVAYNGMNGEYLLVWQELNTSITPTRVEIHGWVMPWNNLQANGSVWIATAADQYFELPSVAWNTYRNEYMVVFETIRPSDGAYLGIRRRRLNSGGWSLSDMEYVIPGGGNQRSPDITYNVAADQYLVVWDQNLAPGNSDINGARLSYQGVLQGGVIPVATGTNDQQYPSIATNEQHRYFVVWQELVYGDYDIRGQLFDIYGNAVGTQHYVVGTFDHEMQPVVAANGATQEYLVVWKHVVSSPGYEIQGKLFHDENQVAIQELDFASDALGEHFAPAVSFHYHNSNRYGFFTTYERLPAGGTGLFRIYGRMLWSISATPWLHMLTGSN